MADRTKRLDRTIKRVGRSGGLQLSEFESSSGGKVRKVPPTATSQRAQDSECRSLREAARATPRAISIYGYSHSPNRVASGRIIGTALEDGGSDCRDNSCLRICLSRPGSNAQEERSIRTIPIGPQTRVLLEEHRRGFGAQLRVWKKLFFQLFPNVPKLGIPGKRRKL